MTSTQALNACIKIDSKRTYCADVEQWHHRQVGIQERETYKIFVLPGCDGSSGQNFTGNSFSECVSAYRAAFNSQPAKPC